MRHGQPFASSGARILATVPFPLHRPPRMSLRNKLLLLALSTLVLPVAGWLLVRQLEALLREGQAQAQLASAEALARAVAVRADVLPPAGPAWYVASTRQPFTLDGYDEEWQLQNILPQTVAPGLRASLAQSNGALHLFIAVDDTTRVRADAHWSQAARADQVLLALDDGTRVQRLRLASAAPGPLIVVDVDGGEAPRLLGEWQEDSRGYRIELRFPQGMRPVRLGLDALDYTDPANAPARRGTGLVDATGRWPLIEPSQALHTTLEQLLPDGMRARLLHTEGWVLARAGAFAIQPPQQQPVFWRRWLYRLLARDSAPAPPDDLAATRLDTDAVWQALGDKPSVAWRSLDDGRRLLLVTAVPVRVGGNVRGALLLERPSEALLLTDQALSGLMLATVLAMLIVGAVLFAFAGRLSGRIRQLSIAAERASTREGRAAAERFPQSTRGDELGDLSRSFAKLLDEVNAYTDYLASLAGKLSHELHTPLAVVRSSLENLESQDLPDGAATYVDRARDGVTRLGAIVRAMSEASRMERAIASADAEDFDLRALLEGCAEGYRPLLGTRELKLLLPQASLPFHGAPELIAQALDKLVDNARSFCPADGWILLALAPSADGAVLAVANAGPPLPEAMQERLFDSLVSVRGASQRGDGAPHLGLGLSVVRLVAELHRGEARARNLPQGGGVEFRLTLRGMPRL